MKKYWLLLLMILWGCPKSLSQKTATVKLQVFNEEWSGTARLMPEKILYITSPEDGFVNHVDMSFGRNINIGETIFTLSAPQTQDSFINTIIDFLKSKDKLRHEQKKLKGEKEMLSAGILSEDEYWSQQNIYQDSFLSFLKAKEHLKELHKIVDFDLNKILNTEISDQNSIEKIIKTKINVRINAEKSGLLLPNTAISDEDNKPITLGSKISKGEIVAAIADYGSYLVKIMLPERYTNKVSKNMSARITGENNVVLPAKVIDYQPFMFKENSGQREFPVTIKISMPSPPRLVPYAYVGMPVEVNILIKSTIGKVVPINAIGYNKGNYFVEKVEGFGVKKIKVKILKTSEHEAFVKGNLPKNSKVIIHD